MKANAKLRTFEIIQVGKDQDIPSIVFDFFLAGVTIVNLIVTLAETFDEMLPYMAALKTVDTITMLIFGIDYALRIWTAEYLYPKKTRGKARMTYILSFFGIVDMLTFLPYFLPIFFPMGMVALRLFRVARIFRLFRINIYSDAFNVIAEIFSDKKDQIISSIFIILILMVASSLCMYSLENPVQPDRFSNAFSGLWWAVSTLLTVGYGDIYPITPAGRFVGIVIAFLGVGTVAIPTGIISAGFVEQYTKLKTVSQYSEEADVRFITLQVHAGHSWENSMVSELDLPLGLILAVICRGTETIVPRGDVRLLDGDRLVLAAESYKDEIGIKLKELALRERHPWVGKAIKDLDISRQTLIVVVRRHDRIIIPSGKLVLEAGDMVIMYTKRDVRDSVEIKI